MQPFNIAQVDPQSCSLAAPRTDLVFGSLFTGIGGMDLGLENAGLKCGFQVEIVPFCQDVLNKHWPDVPRFGDIKNVSIDIVPRVNVLAGGFPCQPHSYAGKRLASADERDLWSEYLRLIRGIKPRWVIAENVPGILTSENGAYFERILQDLHESGFDAEWRCLAAAAFGAPHRRERIFLVAYPHGNGRFFQRGLFDSFPQQPGDPSADPGSPWADQCGVRPTFGGRIYPGLAPGIRVADGTAGELDPSLKYEGLSLSERAVIKARIKGCGNAVVTTVAEHVGRAVAHADSLIPH